MKLQKKEWLLLLDTFYHHFMPLEKLDIHNAINYNTYKLAHYIHTCTCTCVSTVYNCALLCYMLCFSSSLGVSIVYYIL